MKRNTFTTFLIGTITVAALFAFVYILHGALIGNEVLADSNFALPNTPTTTTIVEPRGYGKPTHLIIPSIGVNAKVQYVGVTAKGSMGIPTNFTDVAWYKHGTIPGEVGSAVIDGHVDNGLGLNGVFKKLGQVKEGDDIYVTDEKDSKIHFVVREIKTYPYTEAPTEEIFYESQKSLLRLITCGGKWVKSAKTYDTRVVVTAEYIP
jgi:LPXTG-site transpeptidase (sortase) family protein